MLTEGVLQILRQGFERLAGGGGKEREKGVQALDGAGVAAAPAARYQQRIQDAR
jgi:hypothetical protein